MSCKEWFVACYVLYSYDTVGTEFYNFIYQLHRVTVGEQLANAVYIHYRFFVAVVYRSLNFMFAYFFSHQASKLVVDGVSRTCGYDTTFDGFADKRHVSDNVEKLMACAFVLPDQRLVLNVTKFRRVEVRHVKEVCQLVETFLSCLPFVYYDGVVHVATLYEICFQKWFNVSYKHKGTCRSDFCREVLNLVKSGKLAVDEF